MSSFLLLLAAAASSALPQYPGPFNNLPQFHPTFQNFPQRLTGFQFPQRPLPALFNPNQIFGGQASLPPWLKPQADATEDNTEDNVEVESARFIDNTNDDTTEGTVVADDAGAAAAQKAYEEYLKFCLTSGYGTSGGYSGSYSLPTGIP
jgi:hypothetical protein